MGGIVKAVISAAIAYNTGLGFLAGPGFLAAAISFVGSLALGFVEQALAPKPKLPNLASFDVQARDRTQMIKQPITPWRIIYGEVRVGGPLTFAEATDNNKFLHLIVTLASHPVEEIGSVHIGEDVIHDSQLDADGLVTDGKYANIVRIQKDIGTTGEPFPFLASAVEQWTSDHKQAGRAKVYVRLEYNRDKFTKIPNISAWVKGKQIFDTRSSTKIWNVNPAIAIRDYMVTSAINGGVGATIAEFNDTFVTAAANICDEIVSTVTVKASVLAVSAVGSATTERVVLAGAKTKFQTGDRVRWSTTASAPSGLATGTDYYIIAEQRTSTVTCKLASSYTQALAASSITINTAGDGDHALFKTGEPRYTLNGVILTDKKPADNISDMLTAMAGRASYAGGTWNIYAGAYTAPTITLDEGDMIGPFHLQSKIGRRDRFNTVKGVYVSPLNDGQPADYPPVTSSTLVTNDGGVSIVKELDLPFTPRPHTAMRLAKIALNRMRQEITAKISTNLKGLQVQAGDTVAITNARAGWSAKVFEVTDWQLAGGEINDAPALGVDMTLRETATTVFDWNTSEESSVDPAPNTNLPNTFNVGIPGGLTISETLFSTRTGTGLKVRAIISWNAPTDQFVEYYQVEYKLSSASTWTVIPAITATTVNVDDITPGLYDFRIKAVNILGVSSDYTPTKVREIFGLLAAPAAPQNMTITTIGGLAIIRWDQSSDLDVRQGGKIVFRHDALQTGAGWTTSVSIGDALPGTETIAVLPLKGGTYFARFYDSSGVQSSASSVSTKQATILAFAAASTITESPLFGGVKTDMLVENGELEIASITPIDDWTDVDLIANWDYEGGVKSSGTYDFLGGFDFGSVVNKRLTASVTAQISNVLDEIDSRTLNIDTWADFDGTNASSADVQIWMRQTDDDPSGSPTWGAWQRLDSAEVTARGIDMQARFTSGDPAYNIAVTALSVSAQSLA